MGELLSVLNGYCTVQLKRRANGNNYNQQTIQWKIVGNVLVNEHNFYPINYDVNGKEIRWLMGSNGYAYRVEHENGKKTLIYMAREILGLPRNPGRGGDKADHWNYDIRDNTEENLSVVTPTESVIHRRKCGSIQRFKGYSYDKRRKTYQARVCIRRLNIYFPAVSIDVEAALMYNYAANLVYGKRAHLNIIFDNEMPTVGRQWELYEVVFVKLKQEGFQFEWLEGAA